MDKDLNNNIIEKENKENKQDILKWVIVGFICFSLISLVFGAGIFVGELKARSSYLWAESYHKNFAGPKEGFFGDNWRRLSFPGEDFVENHGVFGEIIQINEGSIVIRGGNNSERLVVVNSDTIIQLGRETLNKQNLQVGEKAVIIGSPNEQGQIEAKLIRIFNGEELINKGKPSIFPFLK